MSNTDVSEVYIHKQKLLQTGEQQKKQTSTCLVEYETKLHKQNSEKEQMT